MVGVVKLFQMITQRVRRHTLRFGALLLAALLLLAATLSLDQLREYLGALGTQLADLFHFLIVFSLFMFLLERLSARTVANVAVATLAAVLALVVVNPGAGLAGGNTGELSSISTIFSLPFLLDVVEQDTLTLRILNFMQVYLTFAVMAICTLLVVALVHVIYLLHENRWIKVLHGASLMFFSLPFLVWAMATVNPDVPLAGAIRSAPLSVEIAWYANVRVAGCPFSLVGHRIHPRVRRGGAGPVHGALRGAAEFPRRRTVPDHVHRGISLVRTLGDGFQPDLPGLCRGIFQAPDRSLHGRRQHPVDRRRDRVFHHRGPGLRLCRKRAPLLPPPARRGGCSDPALALGADGADACGRFRNPRLFLRAGAFLGRGGSTRPRRSGPAYRLLHKVFLFRRERLYHEAKMFEGLVLAGAYHATFNIAASQGRISVMLVLVAGGCAFLYYLLGLKSNREKIGAISAQRVHATFVGRLKGARVRGS